ncbi:D-alanyl-D-alanine carboxypeptidase DacB precursor [Sporotomaculum syntrophicum]|uniref:D-alanyl-D-alanine carboxypeptidase DacB n=1 Tax=Sporotomaculum syntrophicum TaxID=182264 RepID=A0A9D2WQT8_9FIRM|nr:D-alanyl-D-alanine carboxypeptidase [Sporotomaculum syntrophicum]KAF1085231.1 D-alanyl-D-alanine carboxypeptidase DacB precursor [Sporotomaculum syntrophicum]
MRKTKKGKSKFRIISLMIVVIAFAYIINLALNGESLVPSLKVAPDSAFSIPLDNLHSSNAILIQLDNNSILMQKNSRQKIYPASLTKIMTAIVAIEKLPDLQESIVLSNSMFPELYKSDASMAGFQPGEKVRAIDLLYGVMLPSGAESCIGLAEYIAGSEQSFVEMMNQKAMVLGLKNTHFTNTTGLHNYKHYTTVEDLSIILIYALQNNTFRDIFTASIYSTTPTNKNPGGITFVNTMFKNMESPLINDGKILGGKTGYTEEAGLCLASLAQKDGREYILVTAGSKGNHESEQYNIVDAYTVYNKL